MRRLALSVSFLVVLLLSSCGGRSKTAFVLAAGDTIPLRYADNLTLITYPDYTVATLRNPWDTLKYYIRIYWFRHPNHCRLTCRKVLLFVPLFVNRWFIPRCIAALWMNWESQAV